MKLRPYQQAGVRVMMNALRSGDSALCVAATGAGKTEMFIDLIKQAKCTTAVLMGRDKLVEQTARRVRAVMPDAAVWSAGQGEKRVSDTTVVSVHSADALTIPGLRLVIIDEAHNANSGRYARFFERHPEVKVAGFTATPWRGARPIYGDDELFKCINYKVGLLKLINEGYLVRPVLKGMPEGFDTSSLTVRGGEFVMSELAQLTSDKGKVINQVKDAIPRLEGRNKIVWTCTTIEHAAQVDAALQAMGEQSVLVHSKVRDVDYAMDCFEKGPFRHAVSVMMLSEGIDIPSVDAIVLMRPTRSPTLMVQTIGRGLRLHEGKDDCVILDYGQVIANCGPVNDPYINTAPKGACREQHKPTIRVCPECLGYVPADEPVCPDCGHEDKKVVDRLKELTRQAAMDDLLTVGEPETFEVSNVSASQYRSAKGNDCIRLAFSMVGRLMPFYMYCNDHPYAWKRFSPTLHRLTPFEFESFDEAYEACERIGEFLEIPKTITIRKKGKYEEFVDMQA